MKIFYTTDGSIDSNLEQNCPFGEVHHFHRVDNSEFTMLKKVGCRGCIECKYCYGTGFEGPYGSNPKSWVLIPNNKFKNEGKLKDFKVVSLNDYVKCAMCFDEKYRAKSNKLKFKIWWWHHIGIKWNHFRYIILKKYLDTKYEIGRCYRKWFKRV